MIIFVIAGERQMVETDAYARRSIGVAVGLSLC